MNSATHLSDGSALVGWVSSDESCQNPSPWTSQKCKPGGWGPSQQSRETAGVWALRGHVGGQDSKHGAAKNKLGIFDHLQQAQGHRNEAPPDSLNCEELQQASDNVKSL